MSRRTVLITGASRGLGRAIALRQAAAGDRVIVAYRRQRERAEAVVAEVEASGGEALALGFDLRDPEATSAALTELRGPVAALVNNAAVASEGAFGFGPTERFEEILDVGLRAAMRCTHALARDMVVGGGGVIVNVSSVMSRRGQPGQVAYATAKGALEAFTRALALELGSRGVRVNAVVAGVFDAGMTQTLPRELRERWAERIPLGRLGRDSELAEAVAWLLSPASSYVTGACLVVDGGLSL